MALVAPFKGILYNRTLSPGLSQLITPPYDVISPQEQKDYYSSHPYNIIRLDYGLTFPSDTSEDNRYTRAAHMLKIWQQKGILVQDEHPALYLYRIHYQMPGEGPRIRTGLISLLGLEPFHSGQVRPHEKTFSAFKQDRYQLLERAQMQFCPIFSFYIDPENTILSLLTAWARNEPFIDFVDRDSIRHQIWRISDPGTLEEVQGLFRTRTVFIADGHHRYETGLAYKEAMQKKIPHLSKQSPVNFILMFLCNMNDPGLVIFPVHRSLKRVMEIDALQLEKKLAEDFSIEKIPFSPENKNLVIQEFLTRLNEKGKAASTLGMVMGKAPHFYLLTLKKECREGEWEEELQACQRNLDVIILSRLIFQKALGIRPDELDQENIIDYFKDSRQAIRSVESGACPLSFILNPTPVEQVRLVAEASLTMPRKSTYFYPKTPTGLIMHSLDTQDDIPLW